MLRPDLKRFNLAEIRLSFEAKLTEELLKKLESFTPDKDGDYIFVDSYKSERVGHVASAVVSLLNKGDKEFGCNLLFRVARGGRLQKSIPLISELLEIISDIREPVEFSCLLRFIFGRRSKPWMLINLPLKVTDQKNAPFNEIYGAHFVKREAKKVEYEVILDFSEEGGLLETVVFEHTDRIGESVVGEIIQKGMEISKSFASKEELE